MFGLADDKVEIIDAPVSGEVVAAEDIPDDTFSEEIMGPTVGIMPVDDRIYAPFAGKVENVAEENHALLLTSDEGTELMIHVGLETVKLKGAPFTVQVREGDEIKQGDLLMSVDLDAIEAAGLNTMTVVVICNADELGKIDTSLGRKREGEEIFRIER